MVKSDFQIKQLPVPSDSPPPPAGQPLPPLSVRAGEDNLRGGGGGRMGSGSSSLKHIPDGQQLMEETGCESKRSVLKPELMGSESCCRVQQNTR